MTSEDTVTLAREEYEALIERIAELEDRLASVDADDAVRVPHEVASAIGGGEKPAVAYRKHRGFTLQEMSERTGLAVGYLSEIERGVKPGSVAALARMASALGTTIDALIGEAPKLRPYIQEPPLDVTGGQDE